MGDREDLYKDIDKNIAANLRIYREAGDISQEGLAQRMSERGFGFTQATIWKIESGQRPIRASELVALADCLGVLSVISLTDEPGVARHEARLRRASQAAYGAYRAVKETAAAYLEAQFDLLVAAREAHDDGVALTELHTSLLSTPPEEAVIEARVDTYQDGDREERANAEVGKVLDALRATGYEPILRIEDVEISGGGPVPALVAPGSGTRDGAEAKGSA